jgi:acyl-CoA reductase-like NAD-dependent aldehyde dehydrogenase
MANISLNEDFVQIINGKSSPTDQTRHSVNPATLQPKAEVPVATQDDLDRAVAAAKEAFKSWSKIPYDERRRAVLAYADAVDALKTEFRDLLVAEQGKPVGHNVLCT